MRLPSAPRRGVVVDEPDAGGAAALERRVQVVHDEADVMDAGTAPRHEPTNRRIRRLGLEQLDERITGREPDNGGAIGVLERHFGQAEHIAVERKCLLQRAHGDADVRDAGAAGAWEGALSFMWHSRSGARTTTPNLTSVGTAWNPAFCGGRGCPIQ